MFKKIKEVSCNNPEDSVLTTKKEIRLIKPDDHCYWSGQDYQDLNVSWTLLIAGVHPNQHLLSLEVECRSCIGAKVSLLLLPFGSQTY